MNKDKNPIPDYYNFGPYQRVAPRDLFNEAKLLKCLGKVALGILDNRLQLKEVFINPENGFEILQNEDGDIMCNNYYVLKGKKLIYLFSRLNSRLNWPLMTMTDDEEIIEVFDEDGNFTDEFLACVSDNKKKDNPSPKDESFIPPEKVAKEAIKGLEFRKTYGRGGTEVGLKRAHQLKNRENLSPQTILKMYSFFARHGVHEGMNFKENGEPTNHYIAWLLWGGDAGRDWAARMRAKIIKGNNPLIDAEIETEIIKGGRGDSIPDSKFDKTQLNRGIKVEMEHTNNTSIAKEIAKDHLTEDSRYYEKLATIHKENPRPLPHTGTVVFTFSDGSGDIMGIDGKILPFTPDVVCELSKTPKKGDKVKFSTYKNLYSEMIDYLIVINERENKLKPIKDFLKREDDQ